MQRLTRREVERRHLVPRRNAHATNVHGVSVDEESSPRRTRERLHEKVDRRGRAARIVERSVDRVDHAVIAVIVAVAAASTLGGVGSVSPSTIVASAPPTVYANRSLPKPAIEKDARAVVSVARQDRAAEQRLRIHAGTRRAPSPAPVRPRARARRPFPQSVGATSSQDS